MDHDTQIIILYDYYKNLLNEKEKTYFEDYYFNNLSLGEISENIGVSRNNVHKTLKAIETKLFSYEEKLEMYKKNELLEDVLTRIDDEKIVEEIKNIFN